MGFLNKFRTRDEAHHHDASAMEAHTPKTGHQTPQVNDLSDDSSRLSLEARNEKEIQQHPGQVTAGAYLGVKKAEAAALVWSKKAVWATYAWIWVCFFLLALQSGISGNVIWKAYANFQKAPQISTANILYSIIGGVLKLPIAKMLNIWGRAEGLLVFVAVYEIGLIILAACNGPDSYAAGYTLYWIGYDAIYLILDVFVADTSGLKNRAFTFAFASTPFICTAFTAPLAANSFLKITTWRWAYGTFAIVMPVVFAPLAVVFKMYQKKAERMGLYVRERSGRTWTQSVIHYTHEFDVVGAALLMASWVLLLLPFGMASNGRAEYKSATFIAMIVVGFCLLFVFAAWEKWFARVHFIKYDLLKQRTVLGACILSGVVFFSFYCWDLYFYNFCIVVYDLSIPMAGYMIQIYNVGSCFWGVIFGLYVRWTHHFKYACLVFALPLMILGAGLMIHFRGQSDDIGYVIMCQIFIAFGGGTLVIGQQMAVMASADREGVPMMLSFIGLFTSLGGAIGYAVAAAIFNNVFVSSLESRLPADLKDQAMTIFAGGYSTQMTDYPVGTAGRNAINYAWGESQKYGAIAATCLLVLGIPAIAVWKNYNVNKHQNKGVMI
ncbi:putative siderochrome-iron transporter [Aspergillus clavatus NRRL 1]|uniref:Siderochrome-iron transporter, putative n=1 Tax=Aspergillus clavatus (strain ATCC 1007 / CBS 513.65 / DSM 816 / NCTC 3887 / NRRL 1 / QM 1276 / 107) TaxID=344612 RepID=A1CDF6_ASPCL|nr:siderochrome-iron transporter, putative [Aspergillus clavatus NRRL 1]EAW11883.1 siderochrome-iron transporter, putative [Aspergillus clavatus NRRL 1]